MKTGQKGLVILSLRLRVLKKPPPVTLAQMALKCLFSHFQLVLVELARTDFLCLVKTVFCNYFLLCKFFNFTIFFVFASFQIFAFWQAFNALFRVLKQAYPFFAPNAGTRKLSLKFLENFGQKFWQIFSPVFGLAKPLGKPLVNLLYFVYITCMFYEGENAPNGSSG